MTREPAPSTRAFAYLVATIHASDVVDVNRRDRARACARLSHIASESTSTEAQRAAHQQALEAFQATELRQFASWRAIGRAARAAPAHRRLTQQARCFARAWARERRASADLDRVTKSLAGDGIERYRPTFLRWERTLREFYNQRAVLWRMLGLNPEKHQ